jgi:hypothetical protein
MYNISDINRALSLDTILKRYDSILLYPNNSNANKIDTIYKYQNKKSTIVDELNLPNNQSQAIILTSNSPTLKFSLDEMIKYNIYIPYYILHDEIFGSEYFKKNLDSDFLNTINNINNHIKNDDVEALLKEEFMLRFYHYELLPCDSTNSNKQLFIKTLKSISDFYTAFANKNNFVKTHTNINPNAKIKVAFVYERISAIKSYMEFSYELFRSIVSDDVEVYIYAINSIELGPYNPNVIEKFEDIEVKYIDTNSLCSDNDNELLYSRYDKAMSIRNHMIDNSIDMFVYHGYNIYNNFLLSTKSAPRQIFWSDNQLDYDFNNIDKRVMQNLYEGMNLKYPYYQIPIHKNYQYDLSAKDKSIVQSIKNKFPNDAVLIGVLSRLIKINSDIYLQTVAKILKENENAIFICCGSGGESDIIAKKVEALGIADRFLLQGYVDSSIYVHVLDIFLDTFPERTGLSVSEAIFNKCFVIKHSKYCIDRLKIEWDANFKNLGYDRDYHAASDDDDYVQIATQLIKNPSLRDEVANVVYDGYSQSIKKTITAQEFKNLLLY